MRGGIILTHNINPEPLALGRRITLEDLATFNECEVPVEFRRDPIAIVLGEVGHALALGQILAQEA